MEECLERLVGESERVVFFGGAGVSTESGIPDFRSADGLYREHSQQRGLYSPETILSRSFFDAHTAEFFDFYRGKMLCLHAKPNKAHDALARLEQSGKLLAVITQNIDGLHQMAGSKRVLELHGSVHRNSCMDCGRAYPVRDIAQSSGVPRCACGGVIKPDVVLYEEGLDSGVLTAAANALRRADLLIIAGTSLAVYPAAGLVDYYGGRELVVINKTPTRFDRRATLLIQGSVGEALGIQ